MCDLPNAMRRSNNFKRCRFPCAFAPGVRAAPAPELAVISMDGGRYQRRDHFRSQPGAEGEAEALARDEGGLLVVDDQPLSMRAIRRRSFPQWPGQHQCGGRRIS